MKLNIDETISPEKEYLGLVLNSASSQDYFPRLALYLFSLIPSRRLLSSLVCYAVDILWRLQAVCYVECPGVWLPCILD